MRKKIKSPLTLKAQEIILKKLDKLAFSDNEKIEIINQSIENGWKSIYPLVSQRQEKNRNEEMPIYDESVNREFTSEMRQQLMERRNKEL